MSIGTPAEIGFWLGNLRRIPDVKTIQSRWQMSRATAYRWRAFALSGGRSQYAPMSERARKHLTQRTRYDHREH